MKKIIDQFEYLIFIAAICVISAGVLGLYLKIFDSTDDVFDTVRLLIDGVDDGLVDNVDDEPTEGNELDFIEDEFVLVELIDV